MSDSEENPKDLANEAENAEENGSASAQPDSGGGGDATKNKPSASSPPATKRPDAKGDGEASDEEEPKPGLLEQPIVIEGKRQRKKVERLSEKISEEQENESKAKEIVIAEGRGVKLGSIPYVQYQLNKNKPDDLKLFHRILFGRVAPNKEVKKNIVQFSGYAFDKDSKDFEKKQEMVSRVFVGPMKEMLEILGLEKSGHKEELVARMLAFLLKPHDMEKKVPQPKKKKRQRKDKGKKRKSGGGGGEKKASASSAADNDQVSSGSDISDSESDAGNSSDSSPAKKKEPPKKKAKVEKKTEKKPATPKKKATPKKPAAKKVKSEEEVSSDSESESDDEPLVKKKKKPPTDDELKEVIKKILDGADLEEITMKSVCKKVYAKYPEFDLVPRKSFIKATVKDIIN